MTKNVGSGERGMRSLFGAVLASAALLLELEPGWAVLALVAGLFLLGTALASYAVDRGASAPQRRPPVGPLYRGCERARRARRVAPAAEALTSVS